MSSCNSHKTTFRNSSVGSPGNSSAFYFEISPENACTRSFSDSSGSFQENSPGSYFENSPEVAPGYPPEFHLGVFFLYFFPILFLKFSSEFLLKDASGTFFRAYRGILLRFFFFQESPVGFFLDVFRNCFSLRIFPVSLQGLFQEFY